ncbi:MAG TPA: hypothetical protein VGG85_07535 [Terracidiphilus sp.]|jgi:hypothetical protein
MQRTDGLDEHEKFKELCALAQANSLDATERVTLDRHLESCSACRETYDQFFAIGEEGMAYLSQDFALTEEAERWDNRHAREKLFSSIRDHRSRRVLPIKAGQARHELSIARPHLEREITIGALAACLVIAVALGGYQMGLIRRADLSAMSSPARRFEPAPVKPAQADILPSLTAEIARLRSQISRQDQELALLRAGTGISQTHIGELENLNRESAVNLRRLTDERDKLSTQLSETEGAYQKLQADFTNLKADFSRAMLRAASLEEDVTSLTAAKRDRERQLKDDQQYLVSDRDIRELMGARKLYIADVFDVDSASRTKKPFGRVFYTQNKSLVFYAFDLDHQAGVKNASDFQVWGQKDSEPNGGSHPMNLGILYMDSESNRRWVLRSDDPRQLAEIDAVFVTVEPHGGSQKPTGKPLLYALLRKEANHP